MSQNVEKMHQQFIYIFFFSKEYCPTDTVWDKHGLLCYIVLLDKTNGVNYDEAKDRCSKINGTVIMPKTKEEADWIASKVDFGM